MKGITMMGHRLSLLGLPAFAALATAIWLASAGAISTPGRAASNADGRKDPAPQRLKLAQAQGGNRNSATDTGLPGGASSLNETYKDWRVVCVQQEAGKRCAFSQILARQDGQRILAIELTAPDGDTLPGRLVLPFGLSLDAGIILQVDDGAPMESLRFRTCMPGGCIVDVRFDAPIRDALRAGTALKVNALADGGTAAPFSISLQGFGTALDRVEALSR